MGTAEVIVLDTHIWVWWVMGDPRLSKRHHEAITTAEADTIGVSDISLFEVAMLIDRGRIVVNLSCVDWLAQAVAYPAVRVLPVTPAIAAKGVSLSQHHKDPFDRLILATAHVHDAALLTEDSIMRLYQDDVHLI